ncbi:MAG: hypothetical protein J3R72DRAFT_487985 [Linnemannia gamsii]|nr:MAG: hypothetical protein J3R72DRAFT_487985 [Linnemannia gamsii]
MEEAGEKPWASNRIRVLELAVDLGDIDELHYPQPRKEPSARHLTRILLLETFEASAGDTTLSLRAEAPSLAATF